MHVEFQRFGGMSPKLMNRAPRYAADLSTEDETEARALIPPDFFDLKSSAAPSRAPDAFRYEIVVEDGPRRQHVTLSEGEIPDSLRPLVDWLGKKAGVK